MLQGWGLEGSGLGLAYSVHPLKNVGFQPILGVARRIGSRAWFSQDLGRGRTLRVAPRARWKFEICSENGLFTQKASFARNWGDCQASGFRKRGRRNGVASVFFFFFSFSSLFPIFSVSFLFPHFFPIFCCSFNKSGETPFARSFLRYPDI